MRTGLCRGWRGNASVIPALAELCIVDAFGLSGDARRLVMIHADPGKLEFMRDSQRRYPPTTRHPIFDVLWFVPTFAMFAPVWVPSESARPPLRAQNFEPGRFPSS